MKARLALLLSLFVLIGLVLQSCSPTIPSTPTLDPQNQTDSETSAPTKPPATSGSSVAAPAATSESASSNASAAETIKRGGILKVSFEDDASEMDPALSTSGVDNYIKALAYEALVDWDPRTLEIVPSLAKSWEISPDGMKYIFHLREGVLFHNGDPLTSDDVKFTFERIMDPETGSSRATYLERVKSVETPDNLTVILNMKESYAPFLITQPYVLIQSRKYVEAAGGKTSQTMMGTGPFMLDKWIPGQVIRLVRNPSYWRKDADGQQMPYLDGIDLMVQKDEISRITSFKSGATDFVQLVPDSSVASLLADSNVVMGGPETVAHMGVVFSTTRPPMNDKRVRQAISYAIDREEIVKVGLFGLGTPTGGGVFPQWHWAGSDLSVYASRDVDKAKQLLAEAGYPEGKGFPELNIAAGYPEAQKVAEMLVSYLNDIGIKSKVENVEWATFLKGYYAKPNEFLISVCGWGSFGDPDDTYYTEFHTDAAGNSSDYANPELDKVLETARTNFDVSKRKELYRQAESILLEDVPVAFLYMKSSYEAMRPYVKGFVHSANGLPKYYNIWLDK